MQLLDKHFGRIVTYL